MINLNSRKTIDLERKIIKIIVVDDGALIRKTLKIELEAEQDIEVIADAENGFVALEKIEKLHPDLAIIDLEMPGIDGIETLEIISDRYPETKTLVFSSHEEREYIHRAIVAGAKGYLLKGTPIKDLANAVRSIHQGYFQLGSGLLGKLSLNSQQLNNKDFKSNSTSIAKQHPENLLEIENQITYKINKLVDLKTEQVKNELMDLIGKKLYDLRIKQSEINLKNQKNQKILYVIIASQIILLVLFILF
jgi:DNA-binding NarL/FixJ family response regulator